MSATVGGADRFMDAMDRRLGIRAIGLGSTRWRLPGDPENTGAEPDACYYLGQTADRWAEGGSTRTGGGSGIRGPDAAGSRHRSRAQPWR